MNASKTGWVLVLCCSSAIFAALGQTNDPSTLSPPPTGQFTPEQSDLWSLEGSADYFHFSAKYKQTLGGTTAPTAEGTKRGDLHGFTAGLSLAGWEERNWIEVYGRQGTLSGNLNYAIGARTQASTRWQQLGGALKIYPVEEGAFKNVFLGLGLEFDRQKTHENISTPGFFFGNGAPARNFTEEDFLVTFSLGYAYPIINKQFASGDAFVLAPRGEGFVAPGHAHITGDVNGDDLTTQTGLIGTLYLGYDFNRRFGPCQKISLFAEAGYQYTWWFTQDAINGDQTTTRYYGPYARAGFVFTF